MKAYKKAIILALLCIGLLPWVQLWMEAKSLVEQEHKGLVQDIEDALNDVEPGWEKKAVTTDTPVTFVDAQGNSMIYHCLTTQRYGEDGIGAAGLDTDVLSLVVDLGAADAVRSCRVKEQDALLCRKGPRAYLCWTVSSQYSFVIEYTPEAVPEAEIFRMAEDPAW